MRTGGKNSTDITRSILTFRHLPSTYWQHLKPKMISYPITQTNPATQEPVETNTRIMYTTVPWPWSWNWKIGFVFRFVVRCPSFLPAKLVGEERRSLEELMSRTEILVEGNVRKSSPFSGATGLQKGTKQLRTLNTVCVESLCRLSWSIACLPHCWFKNSWEGIIPFLISDPIAPL